MAPTPGSQISLHTPAHREKISSFLPPFIFSSTDFLRMNVVVSISCLLQERYLHFDSLFSCFGIATTSFVSVTKTGTKTKVRTRGWRGEEIKIKAPATQILPRISRISVCSKIFEHQLNQNKSTSALRCGPARPFPSVLRTNPVSGGAGRVGPGVGGAGAEAEEIGCRSIAAQSESDPRQDKT